VGTSGALIYSSLCGRAQKAAFGERKRADDSRYFLQGKGGGKGGGHEALSLYGLGEKRRKGEERSTKKEEYKI